MRVDAFHIGSQHYFSVDRHMGVGMWDVRGAVGGLAVGGAQK